MTKSNAKSDHGLPLLLQAPMVMAMRMPLFYMEMARWRPGGRIVESERAVVEKMAAGLETMGKVQAEVLSGWGRAWMDAMSGTAVTCKSVTDQWEKIAETAMEPYARRVSSNATRLSRRGRR